MVLVRRKKARRPPMACRSDSSRCVDATRTSLVDAKILMSVCFGINILSYEICILATGYARIKWEATIVTANLELQAMAKMEHARQCFLS
ncbi:unnamed protein product [Urochloa humidicola]